MDKAKHLVATEMLTLPRLPFMDPTKVRFNTYSSLEETVDVNDDLFHKLILWHVARCGVRFRKNLERREPHEIWMDYNQGQLHIGKESFGHVSYRYESAVELISFVQGQATIPDVKIPWVYLGDAGDDSSLRTVVEMIETCWENTKPTYLLSFHKQEQGGRFFKSIFSTTFEHHTSFEVAIGKAFEAIVAFAEVMVTLPTDTFMEDSGWDGLCRQVEFVSNDTTWVVMCQRISE